MSLKRPLSVNIMNQLNTPPETTIFQKVMIIFGAGIFMALAALTASLPLNYVSNQPDSLPSTINSGDTAWMIVAACFGILVTPVITFLYANMYGRTTSFLIQVSVLAGSMIAVVWVVITFSLTYAKDANNDQILGFPKYYYMFAHTGANPDTVYATTIPFSIFAIFELSYPLLAGGLIISALIDRVNVYGLLFFVFVWHICIYTPVAHITWNADGFFKTNQIEDFSGGLVVHMTAGISAVAANLFLDWIQAPKQEVRKRNNPKGILFAVLLLSFFWFGINAGKAYMANEVATQSVVNTIGGVAVSILVNYFLDNLEGFKVRNVSLANYILMALIATSPCSGFVTVGGSMVVTIITVLTLRIVGGYLLKEGLEGTPYSVGTLHGLGGSVAFLFTALISYYFVNPGNGQDLEALNGQTYGMAHPIRHHTAAVLAMWICVFPSVLLALFICNFLVPLSKAKQSVQSPKGNYAPSPFGPFSKDGNPGGSAYQAKSNFNIDTPQTA